VLDWSVEADISFGNQGSTNKELNNPGPISLSHAGNRGTATNAVYLLSLEIP
jgi:hypothetical protein